MNAAWGVNGSHVIVRNIVSVWSWSLGARELWLWCALLAAIGYWGNVVIGSSDPHPFSPAAIWGSFVGSGAFTVAAWIMISRRAPKLVADRPASARLILAALGIGVLCALPLRPALALALALLGVGLLRYETATRGGRQAGWLLVCLAGVAMSECLGVLHVLVSRADAQVVAAIWRLLGGDVVVRGNTVTNAGFELDIWIPCASSAELAQVVLAFVVVALYRRGECRRSDLPWLVASLLGSVVLTEIRLTMMARGEADYTWLHSGAGVTVYAFTALALAVAFPWWATSRAASAEAEQPA